MRSKAPVCIASGRDQRLDGEVVVDGVRRRAQTGEDRKFCTRCGQDVPFRVRNPAGLPWVQVLPYRTDGTPGRVRTAPWLP
jgi:hypothetical protein